MALLTIAMVLAMQDTRPRAHEDPSARPGPVRAPRRATPTSGINDPRGRRTSSRTTVAPSPPPVVYVPSPAPPAPPSPPMPSLPPPVATGPQAVRPLGSPQSWVTSADYPTAMMRAHATGQVAFELDVDPWGRASDCRILTTSGWPALDAITCSLARRRARFTPARDASGAAIPSKWSSRFQWTLPDTPVVLGSWARVVRFVVDKDGLVKGCTVTNYGFVPKQASDPCAGGEPWRLRQARGPGTGPVTVTFTEIHRIDSTALPADFVAPAGRQIFVRTIDFSIGAGGAIQNCTVSEIDGLNLLSGGQAAYDCHSGLLYLMPSGVRAAKGSLIIRITTDGEAPLPPVPISITPPPPVMVMAPPAPPAPPPPPSITRPLTPRGSPQGWITNDDYPAAALRAEQSGTVTFRLDVDATGMVEHCTVTGSSGSSVLDTTTCSLMMRRARFNPALDAGNRPVPASWTSRMRWELPRDDEAPPIVERVSWTRVVEFTIGADGRVTQCNEEYFGAPGIPKDDACAALSGASPELLRALRGTSRGPVTFQFRYRHAVTGMTANPVPAIPGGFRPIASTRVTFDVDAWGTVSNCRGDSSPLGLPLQAPDCDSDAQYRPGTRPLSVTVTQSLYTTGDTRVLPALQRATE